MRRWHFIAFSIVLHAVIASAVLAVWSAKRPSGMSRPESIPIIVLERPVLQAPAPREAEAHPAPLPDDQVRRPSARLDRPTRPQAGNVPEAAVPDAFVPDESTAGLAQAHPGGDTPDSARQALTRILCLKLTETSEAEAGCEAAAQAELPPHLRPIPDDRPESNASRIEAARAADLAATVTPNLMERFLALNDGVPSVILTSCPPNTLPPCGIDNRIFQTPRAPGTADHERILTGEAPSWDAELRRELEDARAN